MKSVIKTLLLRLYLTLSRYPRIGNIAFYFFNRLCPISLRKRIKGIISTPNTTCDGFYVDTVKTREILNILRQMNSK